MANSDLHKYAGTYNQATLDNPSGVTNSYLLFVQQLEALIRKYKPEITPFMTLLNGGPRSQGIKSQKVGNMEFSHIAQLPMPEAVEMSASAVVGDTTLTVVDAGGITKRHVLQNTRTGETLYVVDVYGHPNASVSLTAGQMTVRRGFGDITAQAMLPGDKLLIIGTAGEEGQEAFTGISRDPLTGTFYCQEFGWGTGITEWMDLTEMAKYNEWDRINTQALETFKDLQEAAALFGQPKYNAAGSGVSINGKRLYTTAGVEYFCRKSGNLFDFNHGLSVDAIEAAVRQVGSYSTNRSFIAICSENIAAKLSRLPELIGKIQYADTKESLGFNLKSFDFLFGKLTFIPHRKMNVEGKVDKIMLVNIADLAKKEFRGDKIRDNIQTPGQHVRQIEYTTIWGLDNGNPYGCGLIENAI